MLAGGFYYFTDVRVVSIVSKVNKHIFQNVKLISVLTNMYTAFTLLNLKLDSDQLLTSLQTPLLHLFKVLFSVMSVSHRHSHTYSQPQPQALPQPPQLLLSQPDLVLQLPLLHQQGGLHLHKVATKGKREINNKTFYLHAVSSCLFYMMKVVFFYDETNMQTVKFSGSCSFTI